MYEIKTNVAKNRLYLIFKGFLTDQELKQMVDESRNAIRQSAPGFAVISDISAFKPTPPQGVQELERGQNQLREYGMGRIIRVVGKEVIAQMQPPDFERNRGRVGKREFYRRSRTDVGTLRRC